MGPTGAAISIPEWMTDSLICAGLSEGPRAISLNALYELSSVLHAIQVSWQSSPTQSQGGVHGEDKELADDAPTVGHAAIDTASAKGADGGAVRCASRAAGRVSQGNDGQAGGQR